MISWLKANFSRLFWGGKFDHPDAVEVHPASYAAAVREAFWFAARHLENVGQFGHQHRIVNVWIISDGLEVGKTGKAGFWSCGQLVGGCTGEDYIKVAAPLGVLDTEAMRHKWGEAILMCARVWLQEKRHEILREAGL